VLDRKWRDVMHSIYWVDLCDGTERRWFPNKRRAKKYGKAMERASGLTWAFFYLMWKQEIPLKNM
jgi:hypothetical protein